MNVMSMNQEGDYTKAVDHSVEDELSLLLAKISFDGEPSDYIDVDNDVPVQSNDDETEHVIDDDSDDSDIDEDQYVTAAEALTCCITLQSYLSHQDDTEDVIRSLGRVTELVRNHQHKHKKQVSILSFFTQPQNSTL
jgi:hypothetical protein